MSTTSATQLGPMAGFDELALVRRRGVRGWMRRHPRCTNALIICCYLLFALWSLPMAIVDMGTHVWWLVPGWLIIAALLCFRHSWPVSVLVAIMLAEAALLMIYPWNGPQMLGLWFAAYGVGLHRGLAAGLVVALPACAAACLAYLRLPAWTQKHGASIWETGVFQLPAGELGSTLWFFAVLTVIMVFTTGFSVAIGAAVRRGRAHEQEILDWARRSHELAQVGERNRIAREMHDVVAHSLSVMISLADGARVVMRKNPERAGEVLDELSSTGRGALADMRRVIGVLKKGEDVAQARRPIHESLEELYEGFRQAGMPLTVTTTGPALPDDAAFGLTVHRILQESLTNVLRYGKQITDVQVSIEHVPVTSAEEREQLKAQGFSEKEQEALGLAGSPKVIISVSDDGALLPSGAQESVGSGLGIKGMQERAGFYNGSVYAGPGKYRGWNVRAVLEPPVGNGSSAKRTESLAESEKAQ